jgi:hypothetical protein
MLSRKKPMPSSAVAVTAILPGGRIVRWSTNADGQHRPMVRKTPIKRGQPTKRSALRTKQKLIQRKSKRSMPSLVRAAWAAFSRHVRSTDDGWPSCVSCGISLPWQSMHAGHFVHCSKRSPLSYDPRNVHPQCRQCNYYGMQGLAAIRYTQYMQREYGEGIVDELMAKKHDKVYLKRDDLEKIIAQYAAQSAPPAEARRSSLLAAIHDSATRGAPVTTEAVVA